MQAASPSPCKDYTMAETAAHAPAIDVATSTVSLAQRRARCMSASLGTTMIYPHQPLTLVRGQGQYVFDETGKRYLDCTAQNLCISLGFAHPVTMAMAGEQMQLMQHCTSLFFNEQPILYAEELLARNHRAMQALIYRLYDEAQMEYLPPQPE